MNPLHKGFYERLVREDELEQITQLETEGRAWLERPSDNQRRQVLIDDFVGRIPDLLDTITSGTQEQKEIAKLELKMLAEMLRSVRVHGNETNLDSLPSAQLKILKAIHEPNLRPTLPITGLKQPWLFTSAKREPSLFSELRAELESADQLDLIISFIKKSGVRKLEDVFQRATAVDASGKSRLKVRILTTTYMGATDREAVDTLAKFPGVEVKISLDGRRNRLHAKAWLFSRGNNFGTAFIGSANLSIAALIDGIEWTIKISQSREPGLFESAKANFESLWNDAEFIEYDPRNPAMTAALDDALAAERDGGSQSSPTGLRTWFELSPKPFQQAILDRLMHERSLGRKRNLLVAATGTGKTVISAFDYKNICLQQGGQPRLLFVAHQRQILQQAMYTFRQVLRDSNFGELLDSSTQPNNYDHIFAMILTLSNRNLVEKLGADYWHMVVIDEAHHLPATTFDRFVTEIKPSTLLGLTATPERTDGRSLNAYFDSRPDGSPAYSLRIWDALDQQLLCPFEYFATADATDLRQVEWGRSGEQQQLNNLIGADHVRARTVLQAIERYVEDLNTMRAIAFCVSVEHAKFMADYFNSRGLASEALTGQNTQTSRAAAIQSFESGSIKIICTVNLFNEGVDIPSINTLILLRPTQSGVIFQQQIGRGLRLYPGKSCCLILDFIGQYDTSFRFDTLFRSLTGLSRKGLQQSVEQGFAHLPSGCHIQLDKVSRERILNNVRQTSQINRRRLEAELSAWASTKNQSELQPLRLRNFLCDQMIELGELYDNQRSWTEIKRAVGLPTPAEGPEDPILLKRLYSLLHTNDIQLLSNWRKWISGNKDSLNTSTAEVLMLAHQLLPNGPPFAVEFFRRTLTSNPSTASELEELLEYLETNNDLGVTKIRGNTDDPTSSWPLIINGRYERRQIQAAIGHSSETARPVNREGILKLNDKKLEILFVTLDKSYGFDETVLYGDYAVSPSKFHWKTQNSANPNNPSGRRYLESRTNGWRFFLFVREDRDTPFAFCGEVVLDEYNPEQKGPIGITWKLLQPLSAELYQKFCVLRDA